MKNPEHNNNLDHLFNKAKADKQDLDDFERDALAGFDMLDSEQEAKDLKASLDTRIQKELFTKEEKNNPKVYWLAAAGLALVIGLSTLFVINNNDSLSKSGKLAITNTEESKKEVLPESGAQLNEQAVPPPPVESATSVNEISLPKEELEKDKAGEKLEQKHIDQKVISLQEKKEPNNGISSRSVLTPVNAGPKDIKDFENERADRKKDAYKNAEDNIANNNKAADLDDLSKSSGTKGKETEAFKSQVSTVKQEATPAYAYTETTTKDVPATKVAKEKAKNNDKNGDADGKMLSDEIAANNTASGYSFERREETTAGKKTKKHRAKQNATAGVAADDVSEVTPGSPVLATKTASGETNNAPVEEKKEENNRITTYYSGGENAIYFDLKNKLTTANLNQKFDATLFVNENKEVTKAEITNGYDLTKQQKEEVVKILKSLDKFNFTTTPAKKGEYPYKISYRP